VVKANLFTNNHTKIGITYLLEEITREGKGNKGEGKLLNVLCNKGEYITAKTLQQSKDRRKSVLDKKRMRSAIGG